MSVLKFRKTIYRIILFGLLINQVPATSENLDSGSSFIWSEMQACSTLLART